MPCWKPPDGARGDRDGNASATSSRTMPYVLDRRGTGPAGELLRNIEARPIISVPVGRAWGTGTAHLCPDDDG